MKPKVFVCRQIPEEGLRVIRDFYEVEVWDRYSPPPREVLLEKVREVDALVTLLTDKIDKEVLDSAQRLRIIAQYAVGFDNIDVAYATLKGVYVTNTPGVLTDATADLTWALLLAAARRIVEADRFVRSGDYWRTSTGWHPLMMLGYHVTGKTLGIIGMGRIGQAVARRAKGFEMRVLYYQRRKLAESLERELNAKYVDLETLLRESDFVSIHVPLTKETFRMIGEKELRIMKPTAILINTSRGAVVDEEALVKALKEGWIAAAGLDVFEKEPLPPEHPLTKLDNVVLAPHVGSATLETRASMAKLVAENLIAFYKGEEPPTLVNKEVVKVRAPGFN
ncbi:MAG: glyoxylate reductase [Thermofilaceae archaeon]|nr:glyoxylate reductase [Thermofilaceae archaeon]